MNKTGIEYLDYTWNPLAMRCTPVSEGCRECWHLKRADMLAKNPQIPEEQRAAYAGETGPVLVESRLNDPLKVKTASFIGVQFMGDLFHEHVSVYQLRDILNIVKKAYWHTFLILTKRPERIPRGIDYANFLPNAWFGVTVESDKYLWRIDELLNIPAAKRFVSLEPMLGSVDLTKWLYSGDCADWCPEGNDCSECTPGFARMFMREGSLLDWVILGGESGPGAQPMHPDWARSVRDDCVAANVDLWFKQWGEYKPMIVNERGEEGPWKVGKKAAGNLLDGQTWEQRPAV